MSISSKKAFFRGQKICKLAVKTIHVAPSSSSMVRASRHTSKNSGSSNSAKLCPCSRQVVSRMARMFRLSREKEPTKEPRGNCLGNFKCSTSAKLRAAFGVSRHEFCKQNSALFTLRVSRLSGSEHRKGKRANKKQTAIAVCLLLSS